MTKVKRSVGNPEEGGYEINVDLPCDVNWALTSDADVITQFLSHRRRQCGCFTQEISR